MKGLSKTSSDVYARVSKALTGHKGTFGGKHHTAETKAYLSALQSSRIERAGHGGFRNVLYYKVQNIEGTEYSVRGTWELRVANYLNESNVLWIRNRPLKYRDCFGVERTYMPDFYLVGSNEYWEVKGYFSDKDKLKMQLVEAFNDIKIKVLREVDLRSMGILA